MAENTESFDLAVIGGGPGGYVCAIRASQLGMKVALIEKRSGLGGTCLNVGCIPSKALLDSSELYHQMAEKGSRHGIKADNLSVDMPAMIKRKDKVVSQTVQGIDYLVKKNKITRYTGTGRFKDASHIIIDTDEGSHEIETVSTVIATGSEPSPLSFAPFDGKRIISSTEALDLTAVPDKMIIVGGGVIGLELGSVYGRLGTEITVIEYLDRIVPAMDEDISSHLSRALKKINFKFHLNTGVTEIKSTKKSVTVNAQHAETGDKLSFEADYALISIGRKPYTDSLGLENTDVKTDKHGYILTGEQLQAADNIYAIGDVTHGPMLAHKAEEEGVAVAEWLAGESAHVDYNLIPGVVYTWPEAASVGKTEQQLKDSDTAYKKGMFPFKASGRARAADESDGFVKILADEADDTILGVHMLGPRCSDMIAEAVTAMAFQASAEDLAMLCHAHPTFSEAIKEAALMATDNRAIHL